MDLTPTQVAGASFKTVRKGYDPDEVDSFLERTAKALEDAQQQATAMEARARAAVARLQELSTAQDTPTPVVPSPAPVSDGVRATPDEVETITRTLLLAQRTADTTVAEARIEAERMRNEARSEAEATIDSTREMSAKLLEDARVEARRSSEVERTAAENEVQSLVARREFLVGDVDQLEQFLIDQRERLRAAARQIEALCDRVPAGLGQVRPPALSASDDPPGDNTSEHFRPAAAAAFDLGDEDDPTGDLVLDDTPPTPPDAIDPTQEISIADLPWAPSAPTWADGPSWSDQPDTPPDSPSGNPPATPSS
jgi:DivIVA domain-containing protein